jgi:cell shape-determining protein MreD
VKRAVLVVFVLLVAAALQSRLSQPMGVFGAFPDFLMAATMAMALALDPALGALFGFAAGLAHGSIVGLSMGGFIISRTLLGFMVSSLRSWVFQDNPIVLLAAALLGTMLCEGLFFLIVPNRIQPSTLAQLPTESVYNAILAIACYFLIKSPMRQEREPRRHGYIPPR